MRPYCAKQRGSGGVSVFGASCCGFCVMPLRYDIVRHLTGWAILVTPSHTEAFPTKTSAYQTAIEYARKLQCSGYSVHVHVHHDEEDNADKAGKLAHPNDAKPQA
jgi:hypothetical protein